MKKKLAVIVVLSALVTLLFGLNTHAMGDSAQSIEGAAVSIPDQTCTYTGNTIEPAVTVTLNGTPLNADTDYTVEYSNNTEIGTATVTVKGKGNYGGTTAKTFAIEPITVPEPTAITDLVYNGEEQTGVAADEFYTVENGTATNAGTYEATATLSDPTHYCWSDGTTDPKAVEWTIDQFDLSDRAKGLARAILDGEVLRYNGSEQQQPIFTFYYNYLDESGKMTDDDGFELTCEVVEGTNRATDAGEHKLRAKGVGNFTGEFETPWLILGDELPAGLTIVRPAKGLEMQTSDTDFAAAVLSANDFGGILMGAKVTLGLAVSDITATIDAEQQGLIKNKASDYTFVPFYDITIPVTVDSPFLDEPYSDGARITERPLSLVLNLPESMRPGKATRDFKLVRLHGVWDGEIDDRFETLVDVVDATYDADTNTLAFENDLFSVFGVGYKDSATPTPSPTPAPSPTPNNGKGTAKTGDGTMTLTFALATVALVAAASTGAYAVCAARRQRRR